MPKTKLGKWAVGLFAAGIVFNFVAPNISWPGGSKYLSLALTVGLGLAVPVLGLMSIRKQGEKAVLVWIAVILSLAGLLFSVLFLGGELFIGHD